MSTISKLNPKHREARRDRKWALQLANRTKDQNLVRFAAAEKLKELNTDPKRSGEAKARIYERLMEEVAQNGEDI